jgi:hypothetical protein
MLGGNMPKKHAPEIKLEAIARYEAGYTALSISEKLSVPVPTLKGWFSQSGAKAGALGDELLEQAKQELASTLTKEVTDKKLASLIAEDEILSARIRQKLVAALDCLEPTDTDSAALALRAITAASTAVKNTSDSQRRLLSVKSEDRASNELPELVVKGLTDLEINEINEANRAKISDE